MMALYVAFIEFGRVLHHEDAWMPLLSDHLTATCEAHMAATCEVASTSQSAAYDESCGGSAGKGLAFLK